MEVLAIGAHDALSSVRALDWTPPLQSGADIQAIRFVPAQTESSVPAGHFASSIDRIRADFERFRLHAGQPSAPSAVPRQSAAMDHAQRIMNQAIQAQTEVFQVSVAFHAGLSATQHSQNAVKTLVEKT